MHTFRLVNAEGRSAFVKFHWKPKLGLQSVLWNEAVKINGAETEQVAFCTAAVGPELLLPRHPGQARSSMSSRSGTGGTKMP